MEMIRRIMPCRPRSRSTTPHTGALAEPQRIKTPGKSVNSRARSRHVAGASWRQPRGTRVKAMCECAMAGRPRGSRRKSRRAKSKDNLWTNRGDGKWILAASLPGGRSNSAIPARPPATRFGSGRSYDAAGPNVGTTDHDGRRGSTELPTTWHSEQSARCFLLFFFSFYRVLYRPPHYCGWLARA